MEDRYSFDDYQVDIYEFAIYPHAHTGNISELMYLGLGIADEAGEVAGKVKKLYRDGDISLDDLEKEIGDVLWYAARLMDALGRPLSDAALTNMKKLTSRKERGVLGGSGDNR